MGDTNNIYKRIKTLLAKRAEQEEKDLTEVQAEFVDLVKSGEFHSKEASKLEPRRKQLSAMYDHYLKKMPYTADTPLLPMRELKREYGLLKNKQTFHNRSCYHADAAANRLLGEEVIKFGKVITPDPSKTGAEGGDRDE